MIGYSGYDGHGLSSMLARLDQRARGGAEQLGGAVAEDQPAGVYAVALGELVRAAP